MKKLKQTLIGLIKDNIFSLICILIILGLILFIIFSKPPKPETIYIKPDYSSYERELDSLKKVALISNKKTDSLSSVIVKLSKFKAGNKKKVNDKVQIIKFQPIDSTIMFLRDRYN